MPDSNKPKLGRFEPCEYSGAKSERGEAFLY